MKVAEFLVSVLRAVGISHGFSLVGGMAMHLNRAAGTAFDMTYCNHEQAVVAAADGYTKAASFSLPGLSIVTSGPGLTNTTTALASAFFDSVPLFLLAGQVKSADINRYGVRSYGPQEVPHTDLLRPITKLSFTYNPTRIDNTELAEKLAVAMTGRKGPVHIDVPLDIQGQDIKSQVDVAAVVETYFDILKRDSEQSGKLPAELLQAFEAAERPLIVIGNALRIASISQESIEAVIRHLGCPVLFTWASMDLLAHTNPLAFGCAGGLAGVHSNRILQAADFILFLGTRLDLLTTGFNPEKYGKNARRFVVECDPAERAKYGEVFGLTPIALDVRTALNCLQSIGPPPPERLEPWLALCRAWMSENQVAEDREFGKQRLSTYHVASLISRGAATRYLVPTASGYAIEGFARFYKAERGSRFAWAGHVLGSMGLALPSAIGASARLGHCVACIDGDGGFLLNMQELYTLRANPHLSVAIFILNNRGYSSIRISQTRAFQQNFGAGTDSGLSPVDFELLAQIAGLNYVACRTYVELEAAIAEIRHNSRVIVDIFLDDDDYRGPTIMTKFNEKGIPYSTDLEEITWR